MNAFGVIRSSKCAPDDYACQEREKFEWLKTLQPKELGPEPEAMTPEDVRAELERREAEMEAKFGKRRVAQGHFARRWPTRGEHGFGQAESKPFDVRRLIPLGAVVIGGSLLATAIWAKGLKDVEILPWGIRGDIGLGSSGLLIAGLGVMLMADTGRVV